MKANAVWIVAGVLVLGAVASFSRMKAAVYFVRLLLAVSVGIGLFGGLLRIFLFLAPARTADGHGVMPTGQAALALLTSLVVSPLLLSLYVRRFEPRPRFEAWAIRLLCLVFLGLVVAGAL